MVHVGLALKYLLTHHELPEQNHHIQPAGAGVTTSTSTLVLEPLVGSLFTANTMTKVRRNRACPADLAGWLMQMVFG